MPNGTTTSYSYDNLSRLTNLSTLNSALSTINSFTYTYDNVGNKLTKQDITGTHNFTYDNTYQLTQSTLPNETFTYDAVGNRTNTTVDAANKLLQDPNATYQYDNNGNRYIKTQTDGTVVYYSYDYEGRLTRVETQKPGLTSIAVYKYDPLGRRIEKAVTENTITTTTRYLYDNEDIIAEYDGNGNLITKYIHGLGIDEPLAMEKNSSTYYYHADGLGSVVALTDNAGNVAQTYSYDSFGNITSTLNPNFIQPYTFTGREYDQETGMYFYRERSYDQKTGTFISKDPIGFAGGDTNLYRYVKNNPVNWIDPWGLEAEVGFREFYPIPVPYALHCFIRFNKNDKDTLSFDKKGVHPDPNPSGALYSPTIGEENDECVKKEMKKCKAEDYDFTDFNCCHCASTALNACELTKKGIWPNFPYDASNPPYKPNPKKPKSKKK